MLQLLMPVLLLGVLYGFCLLLAITGSRLYARLPCQNCCLLRTARALSPGRLGASPARQSSSGCSGKQTPPIAVRCTVHEDAVYASPRRGFVYNASWGEIHAMRSSERSERDEADIECALPPALLRGSGAGDECREWEL